MTIAGRRDGGDGGPNRPHLLRDASGRIRAPWRLAAFVALTLIALAGCNFLLYPLLLPLTAAAGLRIDLSPWLAVGGLTIGHALTFRLVDPSWSWREVGLGRPAMRPRVLARGALLGGLAVGVPAIALLALGWLRARPAAPGNWFVAAGALALVLAPAAMVEELLFRGYVFAALREIWGASGALAGTSVAFGLVHLQNPGASARSLGLVALAGVFLGCVLLATRSLWAAWAAHLAWNWVLAAVLHSAVSGLPMAAPDYQVVDAGPDWATGGPWGPEGGAAAGVGMAGALAYIYVMHLRRRRREES